MNLERYETEASKSLMRFEFDSTGPKGNIKKRIQFKQFSFGRNVYNVGFGDVMETGEINDLINSDNNDSKKVLATSACINILLQKYPEKYVYASGSCKIRSRLYKIGISNNLEEIQRDFVVYGYYNDQWELFEKNRHYEFLIKLKNKKVYL